MILFLEEVGVGLTHHIPETVQALISCLRLTFRFRWEVINRYRKTMTVDQVQEFKDCLDRIETESKSRGYINEEMLIRSFDDDPAAGERVKVMFGKWKAYRNDDRNGLLDQAIQNKNVPEIQGILGEIDGLNKEFLAMALERMEALIRSE
jgi:hypothetical protein